MGVSFSGMVDTILNTLDSRRRVAMAVPTFHLLFDVLRSDIGLTRLWLVGNKVRNEQEARFLEQQTPGLPVLGYLPADLAVQEADRLGQAVYDYVPAVREAAEKMAGKLVGEVMQAAERVS